MRRLILLTLPILARGLEIVNFSGEARDQYFSSDHNSFNFCPNRLFFLDIVSKILNPGRGGGGEVGGEPGAEL